MGQEREDRAGALARAKGGDRSAFAELVKHHQGMVFSIAYHFLNDPSAAEEVAQEVFLDLYRDLASLESQEHMSFWLRRIASHRCIDHMRRTCNRPVLALEGIAEPSIQPSPGDPLLSEKLRRLIATLSESARAVMVLRFQEDLEPAEIARVLDMPLNTVKSHLQRSLAVLRQKLSALRVQV
jgi:RNA polymerase sigma-70 factor (ECF subfamily)